MIHCELVSCDTPKTLTLGTKCVYAKRWKMLGSFEILKELSYVWIGIDFERIEMKIVYSTHLYFPGNNVFLLSYFNTTLGDKIVHVMRHL